MEHEMIIKLLKKFGFIRVSRTLKTGMEDWRKRETPEQPLAEAPAISISTDTNYLYHNFTNSRALKELFEKMFKGNALTSIHYNMLSQLAMGNDVTNIGDPEVFTLCSLSRDDFIYIAEDDAEINIAKNITNKEMLSIIDDITHGLDIDLRKAFDNYIESKEDNHG